MSEFARDLLRRLRFKKRARPRESRQAIVYLFDGSGVIGQATLIDESAGGARLRCDRLHAPETATHLLNAEKGEAHRIEIAWANAMLCGVRYTKSVTVRGFVDPEFEPLKAFWARSEVRHLLRVDLVYQEPAAECRLRQPRIAALLAELTFDATINSRL